MQKLLTILCLTFLISISYSQQTLYSQSSTPNTWSTTLGGPNCTCSPTVNDTVEISHNWANGAFYPLTHPANIAFGNFLSINPFKVVVKNGGVAYQSGSIPTGMILEIEEGGFWAFNGSVTFNSTASNSIASIINTGSMLVNGSFVNNLNINSTGEFCLTGTITQTLGGTFNTITDNDLSPYFDYTNHGGFSNCTKMIPLPIELLSFGAVRQGAFLVYSFETAIEINNDYFEILVSNDVENWVSVETIKGARNSRDVLSYVVHSDVVNYMYAKLKQVDYDGNYSYSNTITLDIQPISVLITNNKIIIDLEQPNLVSIFDINGKLLYSKYLEIGKQEFCIIHKKGFYFLKVGNDIFKLNIF